VRRWIGHRSRASGAQNQWENAMLETNMAPETTFAQLSDDQLLDELHRLATNERRATVDLLRALIEVDARRLHLREGCSSLFTYCTQVLHLEEGAAYNRIEVMRAARRLPSVLDAIEEGSLTLTTARLLAPHLTMDNHADLLRAARHRSKREVEVLVASLAPRPPVPTVLRKVTTGVGFEGPASTAGHVTSTAGPRGAGTTPPAVAGPLKLAPASTPAPIESPPQTPRSIVAPLSSDTYKLQVTISAATHDKLRRARDLLRHAVPTGNVADVLDRALTLLLDDLERRRCAAVTKPREGTALAGQTRYIPAAVKREVWRRDDGRCAFSSGRQRCTETAFLEFHHVVPYADGGPATVGNIELRCRAHNQYEATLMFDGRHDVVRESAAIW
jgi:hypothetical protein